MTDPINRINAIDVVGVDGSTFKLEIQSFGREDVSIHSAHVSEMVKQIELIGGAFAAPIKKISPSKASIKFGVEFSLESGSLTAVIVKGSGTANLEITLEWENKVSGT